MKYLYILVLMILLCNCSQKQTNESPNTIKVNLDDLSLVSFFDLFTTDIEIIPLETTEDCVMSSLSPRKFILHNNKYYCLDEKQKCIFLFDEKGKFIKRIKKEGQGPGEYTTLEDFTINRYTGNLELMSSFSAINIYDSLGVEFKEKMYLPAEEGIIHNMENITEDIYVFYNMFRKDKKVFFYSKSKRKILADTYAVPDFVSEMPGPALSPFYIYNDSVFFQQTYDGQVFEIDENLSFKTRYYWDMGEHTFSLSNIPPNETVLFYSDYVWEATVRYASTFRVNTESNKYYISLFNFNKKNYTLIYNKETKKTIVIDKFKEDFFLLFYNIYGNTLYLFMDADKLYLAINSDILDEENKKIYDSIKETDNPVLFKFNLK